MIIEPIILELFYLLEGMNVIIANGITDEGEQWYAAGTSHLAVGKEARLFNDWHLVCTSLSAEELCAEVLLSKS